jgi:hypothetical protein
MANVFSKNIRELSTELQRILIDDLVTAFQNRMKVLMRAQEKSCYQWSRSKKNVEFKSIKALYIETRRGAKEAWQ